MLEFERIGEHMNELVRNWDELTIPELVELTIRAFQENVRREAYLTVLLWAAEFDEKGFPKMDADGNVLITLPPAAQKEIGLFFRPS